MSKMSALHLSIQEALGRGERPCDIATQMGVPVLSVWRVLADITG